MMKTRTALVTLALGLPALSYAVQMKLTRPELCSISHHVVVGEVTDLTTQWAAGNDGGIERIVNISVSDAVKGDKVETLELLLPGGQMGEIGHWVEDVPKLMVNGRYLLFVAPDMEGRLIVMGGDQGAVRITPKGARVGERLEEALASVEVCRD